MDPPLSWWPPWPCCQFFRIHSGAVGSVRLIARVGGRCKHGTRYIAKHLGGDALHLAGGMWAILLTDFVQSIFIVLGLGTAWQLAQQSGGVLPYLSVPKLATSGFAAGWLGKRPALLRCWITLGLEVCLTRHFPAHECH